jgi:hypothetical protein
MVQAPFVEREVAPEQPVRNWAGFWSLAVGCVIANPVSLVA